MIEYDYWLVLHCVVGQIILKNKNKKRYSNIINLFILAARKIIIMNLNSNTYKLNYITRSP
jgi:uncharacterized protein involved in response to NO